MSTDVSEVRAASIIKTIMEAARTSETSVDIDLTTWQYIPEDSQLHSVYTLLALYSSVCFVLLYPWWFTSSLYVGVL
jgi:hypothetical protein